ncbi:hypothetical protein NK983_34895, partial [Salmonella enterica subsp. enterica serovar Typhimurium]|nr:hypothetical protein [Salmonella enterica subsp. enterica serovar Typhimurium]
GTEEQCLPEMKAVSGVSQHWNNGQEGEGIQFGKEGEVGSKNGLKQQEPGFKARIEKAEKLPERQYAEQEAKELLAVFE